MGIPSRRVDAGRARVVISVGMDSLLTAAARALAAGDPLGALERIALRDEAPALALRGVAMAQLGDLERARWLLRRASRAFGPREALARARCLVALAEVALAARDLAPIRALDGALRVLEAHGDRANALHGRLLGVRRRLLLGRVDEAETALAALVTTGAPPALAAVGALAAADLALRRLRPAEARAALHEARAHATRAGIGALAAEVDAALATLAAPVARAGGGGGGGDRLLTLDEVAALLASGTLVVDACRRLVCGAGAPVSLATRPVLFALARTLAAAWPHAAARAALIADAFAVRRGNDSHRARLRVEIGRLRRAVALHADVRATPEGFVWAPRRSSGVVLLLPPIDGEAAALLALLADGQAWSTSALALALGASQRTVQRALGGLEATGKVRALGRARARRWVAPPVTGFATTLLLPMAVG